MPKKIVLNKTVSWLGDELLDVQKSSINFHCYERFSFKNIIAGVGDFVLVSNADSAEPDTEVGCDAAKILSLYEDGTNNTDPFRAKVQWYTRPDDLPTSCLQAEDIAFLEKEVLEDHRPFDTDVSIETFFRKCSITLTYTKDTDVDTSAPYHYICRYRLVALSKRKVQIEPVLQQERDAIKLLSTPAKGTPDKTPKTPTSLIKRIGRVSISEPKNWSVTKNDGTKLLLKRAILADKTDKDSPKKVTPKPKKADTPRSKIISKSNLENVLSMELQENSDEELPTLIIRMSISSQHVPPTPKRRSSVRKTKDDTPTKVLLFDDDDDVAPLTPTTRSSRVRKSVNYAEPELSPVKRTARFSRSSTGTTSPKTDLITPRKSLRKISEDVPSKLDSDDYSDEELPTLIIRSGRVKNGVNYAEPELSPVKRTPKKTPRKSLRKICEDDDNDFESIVQKTPKKSIKKSDDGYRSKSSRKVDSDDDNFNEISKTPVRKSVGRSSRKTDDDDYSRKSSKMVDSDDDDFKPMPKTPRTPKSTRTPRATPGRTPRRKIIKDTVMQSTPSLLTHSIENQKSARSKRAAGSTSLHSRSAADLECMEVLPAACCLLPASNEHLNCVLNTSLPGRERHLEEILAFIRSKLLDGTSGCMYISGVPGTGKTATVCAALAALKQEDVPHFTLVEVNGMKIAEPRHAYVHIYRQLTGKTVVWEQACALLEKRFTNPGPRRTPTVLLVDELDALCTRRQDVLYSIMEWAAHNTALLTVLAVANTMDLPERALAARVASRLGLTRLSFAPYTHAQLHTIVALKLDGANVTSDAVQLIARKVAAVSGDARRALALCTRALELADGSAAGLSHVQQALGEAVSSATVRAIKSCAPAERLMLRAIAAEVERTGSDETTLARALLTAGAIVALDGRPYKSATSIRPPSSSQAFAICARLAASRLLLLEPKAGDPRLILNVSADDVHYATRQITV